MSLASRLETIHRDFFLGGMVDDFKFHLVNWNIYCTPVYNGGSGNKKLLTFKSRSVG